MKRCGRSFLLFPWATLLLLGVVGAVWGSETEGNLVFILSEEDLEAQESALNETAEGDIDRKLIVEELESGKFLGKLETPSTDLPPFIVQAVPLDSSGSGQGAADLHRTRSNLKNRNVQLSRTERTTTTTPEMAETTETTESKEEEIWTGTTTGIPETTTTRKWLRFPIGLNKNRWTSTTLTTPATTTLPTPMTVSFSRSEALERLRSLLLVRRRKTPEGISYPPGYPRPVRHTTGNPSFPPTSPLPPTSTATTRATWLWTAAISTTTEEPPSTTTEEPPSTTTETQWTSPSSVVVIKASLRPALPEDVTTTENSPQIERRVSSRPWNWVTSRLRHLRASGTLLRLRHKPLPRPSTPPIVAQTLFPTRGVYREETVNAVTDTPMSAEDDDDDEDEEDDDESYGGGRWREVRGERKPEDEDRAALIQRMQGILSPRGRYVFHGEKDGDVLHNTIPTRGGVLENENKSPLPFALPSTFPQPDTETTWTPTFVVHYQVPNQRRQPPNRKIPSAPLQTPLPPQPTPSSPFLTPVPPRSTPFSPSVTPLPPQSTHFSPLVTPHPPRPTPSLSLATPYPPQTEFPSLHTTSAPLVTTFRPKTSLLERCYLVKKESLIVCKLSLGVLKSLSPGSLTSLPLGSLTSLSPDSLTSLPLGSQTSTSVNPGYTLPLDRPTRDHTTPSTPPLSSFEEYPDDPQEYQEYPDYPDYPDYMYYQDLSAPNFGEKIPNSDPELDVLLNALPRTADPIPVLPSTPTSFDTKKNQPRKRKNRPRSTTFSKHKNSGISGTPGNDYPTYATIPQTKFSCNRQESRGYFADVETRCQVFHLCPSEYSMPESFLCPNGTVFNQRVLVCDWWYNVDCEESPTFYAANRDIYGESSPIRRRGDDDGNDEDDEDLWAELSEPAEEIETIQR